MKIGILTYPYAINYGAVLQAYALKYYLDSLGHETKVINYDGSQIYLKKRSLQSKIVSTLWKPLKYFLGGKKKVTAFAKFRNEKLNMVHKKICSESELKDYTDKEKFDMIIVGSDQVWNPHINGYNPVYYLSFVSNIPKIAYAASFGIESLTNEDQRFIKKYLESFSSISVREKTGKKLISEMMLSQDCSVVLDPVFLLDRSDWMKISDSRLVKQKYVLCYIMPGDKDLEHKMESTAVEYAKERNLKVVFVGRKEYKKLCHDGKDYVSASPTQFISLIQYAEYVITNSFHGTAFSVIFNKNFNSFVNRDQTGKSQLSSRIIDLLTDISMENRILGLNGKAEHFAENHFCEEILQDLIKKSMMFINNALSSAKE